VPELAVTTQGKTREEAKRNLREALQLHLEAMAEYAIQHGRVTIKKARLAATWNSCVKMPKLPVVSGRQLVKILTKHFGFRVLRQRGSHVTLTNDVSFITRSIAL
jgi:hypothetical protein